MIWVILALLGLSAGSFISALTWRLRQQEIFAQRLMHQKPKSDTKKTKTTQIKYDFSILSGRSVCPHCHHKLAWFDLIPLLSWFFLRGKCRYCKKPISKEYPIIEISAAAVFLISYAYWPGGVFGAGEWLLLITWLMASVGLMALFIYDLKWMLLPNRIIYPTLAVAVAGRAIYILSFEADKAQALAAWALSVIVASGFFWLIFMVSLGKWIGYGDVRLGLITGTVLADPIKSVLMIFTASVLGSLVALPALITGRKRLTSHLPFGPFLIAATVLVLFFGSEVINYYQALFE